MNCTDASYQLNPPAGAMRGTGLHWTLLGYISYRTNKTQGHKNAHDPQCPVNAVNYRHPSLYLNDVRRSTLN
jgi:hypothetical protein